ncbi:unnamed protein product [Trifolium pratense]|uniref:Uncharacterized protein n=1 Tax=Trifolium pratense TaxID=57577 RepID=A0ACB0IIS6_TRIPR|nr:unnamed protein product [Trifolium pratense]
MESYRNRNMTCILRIDTQSHGWEKSITKVIKGIKDVSYTIDTVHGIIRISGAIDPNKLLTEIKKAGKHAELIHADIGNDGEHSRVHHADIINNGIGGGHPQFHSNANNGYGYNEYNGGHGNIVPSYNNIQCQSDPYQYNRALLPNAPPQEQWQHPQIQQYNDTDNPCIVM